MAGSGRGTACRAPRRCPCRAWERGDGPVGTEKGSRRECRRTANDVQPCRSTRAHRRPTQRSTPPSRFGASWRGVPSPLGGQVLGAGQETLFFSPKRGSPRRVRRSRPPWSPTLSRPPPMPRGRRGSTSARTHPLPPSSRSKTRLASHPLARGLWPRFSPGNEASPWRKFEGAPRARINGLRIPISDAQGLRLDRADPSRGVFSFVPSALALLAPCLSARLCFLCGLALRRWPAGLYLGWEDASSGALKSS